MLGPGIRIARPAMRPRQRARKGACVHARRSESAARTRARRAPRGGPGWRTGLPHHRRGNTGGTHLLHRRSPETRRSKAGLPVANGSVSSPRARRLASTRGPQSRSHESRWTRRRRRTPHPPPSPGGPALPFKSTCASGEAWPMRARIASGVTGFTLAARVAIVRPGGVLKGEAGLMQAYGLRGPPAGECPFYARPTSAARD